MCAQSFENSDAIYNELVQKWCVKMVCKRQPRFMVGEFSGSGSFPDGLIDH